jgi:hypothetical protein
VRTVAIDTNGAYEARVKAQCFQAKLVYDRF